MMKKVNAPIFVVDDDQFHLEIMKQLLADEGAGPVLTFKSGVDCLNQIHLNPRAIFLDHQMDVYNGYETLQKIKRYNPNIFVVMVSAQEDLGTAVATLKYGAFDYIRKDDNLPVNIKTALIKIKEVGELLKARKPTFFKSLFKFL